MTEVVKNKYETVIVLSAKLGEEGVREDSRIRSTRKPKATTPS